MLIAGLTSGFEPSGLVIALWFIGYGGLLPAVLLVARTASRAAADAIPEPTDAAAPTDAEVSKDGQAPSARE